jgi:hypothetical protein
VERAKTAGRIFTKRTHVKNSVFICLGYTRRTNDGFRPGVGVNIVKQSEIKMKDSI